MLGNPGSLERRDIEILLSVLGQGGEFYYTAEGSDRVYPGWPQGSIKYCAYWILLYLLKPAG